MVLNPVCRTNPARRRTTKTAPPQSTPSSAKAVCAPRTTSASTSVILGRLNLLRPDLASLTSRMPGFEINWDQSQYRNSFCFYTRPSAFRGNYTKTRHLNPGGRNPLNPGPVPPNPGGRNPLSRCAGQMRSSLRRSPFPVSRFQ